MAIKLLKELAIITWAIGAIAISYMALSFAVDIPYHDMMRVFTKNDFFWFDGRHIAYFSTAPFLIFIIFTLLIIIFYRNHQFPKKYSKIGSILTIVTLGSLVLLNSISILFYLYIVFFTSYKNCETPGLSHYFVLDFQICQTIEMHTSD